MPRRRWNMLAALAAAYFMLLQSVLGAFAFGLGADAGQLDAFGNVICTHDGAAEGPTGDGGFPHHMPACCVLGCAVASPIPGSAPLADMPIVAGWFETVVFNPPVIDHLAFERDHSPSNPRAPPFAA